VKSQILCNLSLPNYRFSHVDSTSNTGGVAAYIHQINYEISPKQLDLCNSKNLWLTLSLLSTKVTVGVVYRHPSAATVKEFIDNLALYLESLNGNKDNYYILGDIHINLLPGMERPESEERLYSILRIIH